MNNETAFPIRADFHMHSSHSGDSESTMESMIAQAISSGLNYICFTEHHDIDYVYDKRDVDGMFELATDSYLYDLIRIREKFAGQIDIRFGVELGLQPHLARELSSYARSYDFDFIIGSTHLCGRKDVAYPSFFEGRTDEAAYREYFEEVLKNILKFQNFDVCGHLDYVVRYGASKDSDYSYEKYSDILDRILQHLIDNEKGIELNTGGLARGLKEPNPCAGVLKRYKELGGEIITIGSDAHVPKNIAYRFDHAAELLRSCGFRYYSVFQNRLPEYRRL